MIYRPIPDPLSKPPAGSFAAVGMPNLFIEKRPNWIQRTFAPFPYVYVDYGKINEDCRAHFFTIGVGTVLMCCGWIGVGYGLLVTWLVFMMLGFTGLFHRGIEGMDWKESK